MQQFNNNLLRQYFTQPSSNDRSLESSSFDIRTKKISTIDPTIIKIQNNLIKLKHDLKKISLELLQKASNTKYQMETIRGLGTKILILENQLSEKSYLSNKSKIEINNKLKNYTFTLKILKGEYLELT